MNSHNEFDKITHLWYYDHSHAKGLEMKHETIPAGQFKVHCLQIMNDVSTKHKRVVITKRGVPIAQLVPPTEGERLPLFGWMEQSVILNKDIVEPLDIQWEVVNDKDF